MKSIMEAFFHSCLLWLGLDKKLKDFQKNIFAFLCASFAAVSLTSSGVFSIIPKTSAYRLSSVFYTVIALLIWFAFRNFLKNKNLFADWKALLISAVLSVGSIEAELLLIGPKNISILITLIRLTGLFLFFSFAVRCIEEFVSQKRFDLKAAGIAALIAAASMLHMQSRLNPAYSGMPLLKVLPNLALFIVLTYFFSGFSAFFQVRRRISLVLLSAFFGLVLLLSERFNLTQSWNSAWENASAFVRSVFLWGGMSAAMYGLLLRIERIQLPKEPFSRGTPGRKSVFIILVCILLIIWTPYILAQLPAGINLDTRDQFAQITGKLDLSRTTQAMPEDPTASNWNNHHSALYNVYLAIFLKVGEWLHSNAAGVFLAALVQTVALACLLVHCLLEIRVRFPNRCFFWTSLIFFALNPLMPLWGMTIQKDVFYGGVMMLVVLKMHHMLCESDKPSLKDTILLGFYLLLMIALRRTGIYVAAAVAVFAVVILARNKKHLYRIAAAFAASILIFQFGISGCLFRILKIRNGSPRGTYSVPFMQTARYLKDYREDVTPEEEKAILAVIGGPDFTLDEIVENYVPVRADKVIFLYNKYATREDVSNYLKTWASMLVRHPDAYFQGFLSLVWPWFDAGSNHDRLYYDSVMCDDLESVLPGVERQDEGIAGFATYIVSCLAFSPLTMGVILTSALTWIMVVVLVLLIRKKKYCETLSFLVIVFNYCIGFIGPVAYMRYSLGMLFSLPFAICMLLCNGKENQNG